jgi:hypothetical protein
MMWQRGDGSRGKGGGKCTPGQTLSSMTDFDVGLCDCAWHVRSFIVDVCRCLDLGLQWSHVCVSCTTRPGGFLVVPAQPLRWWYQRNLCERITTWTVLLTD